MVIYVQSSLMILMYHYFSVIVAIRVLDISICCKKLWFWIIFCSKPDQNLQTGEGHCPVCRVFSCGHRIFGLFFRTVANVCLPRLVADVLAWVLGHSWSQSTSFFRTHPSSSSKKNAAVCVKRDFGQKTRIPWGFDKSESWNQFKTCSFWDLNF